jgi:hypothetical protein
VRPETLSAEWPVGFFVFSGWDKKACKIEN